jgi:hypothetical protein
MARTKKVINDKLLLTSKISLSYLCKSYSKKIIDKAIVDTDSKERRVRILPSNIVFYYTLALVMHPGVAAKEVMRILLENIGFRTNKDNFINDNDSFTVAKSAITKARKRLGYESLKNIYENHIKPIANKGSKGSFYKDLRLVAIDGTIIDLPDSKENEAHFKRQMSDGKSPFPQARMISIAECGTHVIFKSHIASIKTGEVTMAKSMLKNLSKGMLCTADRNYFCYELWDIACNTGASLLWRVRNNANLPVERIFSDHSYLSTIKSSDKKQKRSVRVIELISKSVDPQTGNPKEEIYRFISNILDPDILPAVDASMIYRSRWEIETSFKELKISLPNYKSLIRAKVPDLVYQEIYAILLVHYSVRKLMHEAAQQMQIDPDELSFTHSLNVVKRKSQSLAIFSPEEEGNSQNHH